MTQSEHFLVFTLVWFISWHLFLKHYVISEKEVTSWEEYFKNKFF